MAKIKVTGLLDSGDLNPEHVDLSDDTGLSEAGFLHYSRVFGADLDDVEFVADDTEEG